MEIYPIVDISLAFAYYYPLFMAYLWMFGGLYYRYHWESAGGHAYDDPPQLDYYPPVSILVPCHNEAEHLHDTIKFLLEQAYPDFEVIAINDGSTDDTAKILDQLSSQHARLRVAHLATNQGKAMALRAGALISNHEILICIDGDALLDKYASTWLVSHFIHSPRVAAVTGNPRVRNRSTLLGKIQVGEFSSIIGMIKRSQRIYGRVFTVSGVVVAFRKSALHRVNFWELDMVTEDIDVSWRLQIDHWDIRYEPNALCWILMPETFSGLWRQRLRWAQGGAEVMQRYFKELIDWKSRRMWGVVLEYMLSVAWSYTVALILLTWVVGKFIQLPPQLHVPTIVPGWNGVVLGVTCLMQFFISLIIDSRYEKGLARYYYWMVWYPLAYWVINVLTTVVGVPKALLKRRGKRATWVSPDRGIAES
jgi:poly-beta-1,6-N-acetyl-D-glucosamine synthase